MNEIFHEDAVTGTGFTEPQRELQASVAKLPPHKRERYGLAIQRRHGKTAGLTGLSLAEDLTVTLVYDSESRRGQLRTNGMVCRFARSPFGLVGVDTRGRFNNRSGDLRLLPRRPVQLGESSCTHQTLGKNPAVTASSDQLLSKSTGYCEVRRIGPYLDLCVGEIEPAVSLVQYRLHWFDFTQGKVAIYPADDEKLQAVIGALPPGGSVQLGWTGADYPLAEVKGPIEYVDAIINQHGHLLQDVPEHQLRWDSEYLSLFAALNDEVSVNRKISPDPIPVYVAFSPTAMRKLPDDPRFTDCSLEVLDVLSRALSPEGYYGQRLVVQAPKTGKIVQVISRDDEQQLSMADGSKIILPPCAVLKVVEGQVVKACEALGEYLPTPECYEPQQLVQMFGRHLRDMTIEAMWQLSIPDPRIPEQRGWVPQALVMNLTDQAVQRPRPSGDKEPLWALDLTGLSDYYDPSTDALILPSLRRTPHETQYWGSTGFVLCGLDYPLRPRPAVDDRPQPKKSRRGKPKHDHKQWT